jgi:di/tricarboxylate transporter
MLIDSLRSTLGPYARHAPLFLLFVVLPALAMLLRFWRRRPKSIALPSSSATAAAAAATIVGAGGAMATTRTRAVEDVRRRLSGVQARRGLLSVVWDETVRAIWDTIAMGGRGLV